VEGADKRTLCGVGTRRALGGLERATRLERGGRYFKTQYLRREPGHMQQSIATDKTGADIEG